MNSTDPELEAMAQVEEALQQLSDEAVARVLRWAAERHGVSIAAKQISPTLLQDETEGPADIAQLFAQASLRTDADRALLAAYWFQHHGGSRSFTGQQINTELKQMGIGIQNVTQALNRLIGQRPALVQQLSKSGRSKQARKQYRLTTAGMEAARVSLTRGVADEEE